MSFSFLLASGWLNWQKGLSMNWLSGKEVDMVAGLYEWSNRIDNLHADTEDKGLAKSVICNLLWMVTQE